MNKVNEKPILFSTAMVKSILAGRKTTTRRVIKPQPIDIGLAYCWKDCTVHLGGDKLNQEQDNREMGDYCPYGKIGDNLWVRETWAYSAKNQQPHNLIYKADNTSLPTALERGSYTCSNGWGKWTPSIFMPRKFSRITLEITGIKVERQTDITLEDAIKEGFPDISEFNELFLKLNPHLKGINPWVWVISFKVLV